MKSNFKRLMGMLLAILMIVTMIPVTAFADVAPTGSSFVVGDTTYYFMKNSTNVIDGKNYYGVFTTEGHVYGLNGAWTRINSTLNSVDGKTTVSGNTEVKMLYGTTDIQTKVSLFEPFGTYICPTDTEWEFYNDGTDKVYLTGSVGIPTLSELNAFIQDGIITVKTSTGGAPRSNYVITRTMEKPSSQLRIRFAADTGTYIPFVLGGNLYPGNPAGLYFMTYVSEDFFKSVKIPVDTMAEDVRTFLTTNCTTAEMLSANIYTAEELRTIGFTVAEDDLKVSSVTLDKTSVELPIENTVKLNATVKPDYATDKSVVWSVEDDSIATVDQDGVVTGVNEGKTKVKVTSVNNSAAFAECEIEVVIIHADSVELDKDTLEVYKGYTEELTATVKPDLAYNKEITWKSSDETIATVVDGVVKGINPGTATITVTTVDGGKTDTCEVTVKNLSVDGVELNKDATTVYVGDKETLTAVVSPDVAEEKSVKWSSDNEAVAIVIGGVVEGISEGTANITVTTVDGGKTDVCTVTVKTKDVTDVKLDQTSIDINVRETKTLTATVEPSVALNKNIVWTSSDEEVATVKDGVVTGVKAGTAVITATSAENDTIYAACDVNVHKVAVESITLDKTSVTGIAGTVIKLAATVNPDNATVFDVIWTSSDESIATVVNGNVNPLKAGTVTIKATSADDDTKFAECAITVISGYVDSPNYLKLENGVELLFNEVKTVGEEKYFGFTIAKDYAGTTTTRGLYWIKDSVDPLGNTLDNTYGEYYYQADAENSRTDTTLDTMDYGLPAEFKENILLNEWTTGFQYPLNGSGAGLAKSKTYFCLPSLDEIREHSAYIANMITDNTNSAKGDGGPQVAIIRSGDAWNHHVYSLAQDKALSPGQGLPNLGGSVFPTFYVNVNAFGEVKFDLDTVGADVKAAIMSTVPRSVIKQAGYDANDLVNFGYVEDVLEVTNSVVNGNTADIDWKFVNNDTVSANPPIIMAVAYGANNKMIKAVPVFPADPAATIASNAFAEGSVSVTTSEAPAYIMLYALKNSIANPYPLADAVVVSGTAASYSGAYSTDAVDVAISTNADFTISGTTAPNANTIVIVTKPGKTVADLATSAVSDVILNIVQVKSSAAGKYGFAFTEDKANLEYLKYTAGIYSATVKATDSAIFKDSGFDAAVKTVYGASTLDEFVAVYGDTLDIDNAQLALLTPEQKDAVKAAVNVGGMSADAIGTAINNKAKEVFVTDTRTNLASQALASFATNYSSKLEGLDAALASSVDATQEAKVKAAVVIENDDTPKEIADKINKELAVQLVSKANTVDAVKKVLADYNKYMGIDFVNWIDKVADKNVVYAALSNETFNNFNDLKEFYEKTVLITRINSVSVYTTIQEILSEYADANGEIYGVDVDAYKSLESTEFANSLAPEYDDLYVDWADFVTTFNANVIAYTPSGSGSGSGSSGGGGGGGGGKSPQIFVEFSPEMEQQITPTTPKYMFADLGQAEWAVTYVEALTKLGHINGKGNNTFCPNDSIKREEVVKILVSALGLDVSATEASFTDVDAGAWYAPYLAAAKASGIVNGKPDGSFGIGAEITREELATMIYRAAGLLASETDVEFADEAEIADYAKEAVSTLVATGVINGKGNNLFAPKANATRAEASKIIYLAVIGK